MRQFFILLTFTFFVTLLPLTVHAEPTSPDLLIQKKSDFSVKETMDRLVSILETKKKITIFARIDHSKNAKEAGLDLPAAELLIFGNPVMGTKLMTANQTIGLDLPMKAQVWENLSDGTIWIAMTNPISLKQRYHIEGKDKLFDKMTTVTHKLMDGARLLRNDTTE